MLKEIQQDSRFTTRKLKSIIEKECYDNTIKIDKIINGGILTENKNGIAKRLVEYDLVDKDSAHRNIKIEEIDGEKPLILYYDFEQSKYITKEECLFRYKKL